jgi:molybdate transport system substrate-binding protein
MGTVARVIASAIVVFVMELQVYDARASDIRALMTQAMQSVMQELGPMFEKASGHKLSVTYGISGAMAKRVRDGEPADILVSTRSAVDGLIAERKVAPGFDTVLARSSIGVAVRRGSPKPDISTTDALRRSLRAARAISYTDPAGGGPSGVHFSRVLDRLGIAGEMTGKTVFPPAGGGLTARFLVSGEAEIAVQQMVELMSVDGIEVVGPLPSELQLVTTYVAAIPAGADQPDAAQALLRFLRSPDALTTMKAKGLEPGP